MPKGVSGTVPLLQFWGLLHNSLLRDDLVFSGPFSNIQHTLISLFFHYGFNMYIDNLFFPNAFKTNTLLLLYLTYKAIKLILMSTTHLEVPFYFCCFL